MFFFSSSLSSLQITAKESLLAEARASRLEVEHENKHLKEKQAELVERLKAKSASAEDELKKLKSQHSIAVEEQQKKHVTELEVSFFLCFQCC